MTFKSTVVFHSSPFFEISRYKSWDKTMDLEMVLTKVIKAWIFLHRHIFSFLFTEIGNRAASFLFGGKVWLQLVLENYTAVFNRVSKGLHWFCFSSLRDWSTKLAHSLAPIRSKTKKAITTWSPAFSRALGS